jgi:hypothetical protein
MKRLKDLRDETRQEFFNLGESLVWCGFVTDDLEEFSKRYSRELFGFQASGFDRRGIIKIGKRIITLLRRSKSVMASVHLATSSTRGPLEAAEEYFSESEAEVYEYLDSLTYWAFNDVDRIRDLCRAYSDEIAILEQQESNDATAKSE